MTPREYIETAMNLARECGQIERRYCIGKAQGFDVRDSYIALESHLREHLDEIIEATYDKGLEDRDEG
jgi:hypothetical protein